MDWNQNLIPLTVDPNRVVVVPVRGKRLILILVRRCELNVNVLADASWDHALLLVANFEERCLRW